MFGMKNSVHPQQILDPSLDEVVYEFRNFANVVVEDYGTSPLYYGECLVVVDHDVMIGVYSLKSLVALDDAERVFDDTMVVKMVLKTFLSTFLTAMCVVGLDTS